MRTPSPFITLRTPKFTFPVVKSESPRLAQHSPIHSTPQRIPGRPCMGLFRGNWGPPRVGVHPRPHGEDGPGRPGSPGPEYLPTASRRAGRAVGAASMSTPFSPRRHPPEGPLPSSSLQGLAPAHPSSLKTQTLPPPGTPCLSAAPALSPAPLTHRPIPHRSLSR